MKEDIKILEQILNNDRVLWGRDKEALENLLKRYKELEEENKTKLDFYKLGKENARKRIEYDYIPKSVIQEKIEELKDYKVGLLKKDYAKKQLELHSQDVLVCNAIRDIASTGKIQVLQELLEEENE